MYYVLDRHLTRFSHKRSNLGAHFTHKEAGARELPDSNKLLFKAAFQLSSPVTDCCPLWVTFFKSS